MTNKIDLTKPVRLETSRAWRTYLGGSMISALHGEQGSDDHFPEEWLMSTVTARNSGREHIVEGVSRVSCADMTLAELAEAEPEALLGKAHAAKYGSSPGVLVKLLDSAERLTLQVHPTRECARELFGSAFGKTECWHIIGKRTIGGEEPCIYMGFREGITRQKWVECFQKQDIPAMLQCLHKIPVNVGDTFIIRGGVPHGIGAGCFLVEIQEPTDYTVRTERVTPSGLPVADFMCHQGLGLEKMFECFRYQGASLEQTLAQYRVAPVTQKGSGYTVQHIIHPAVTDMFALDLVTVEDRISLQSDGSFSGIYVLSGEGSMNGAPIGQCDHYFIPASCPGITVQANAGKPLTFIRCFGPNQQNSR